MAPQTGHEQLYGSPGTASCGEPANELARLEAQPAIRPGLSRRIAAAECPYSPRARKAPVLARAPPCSGRRPDERNRGRTPPHCRRTACAAGSLDPGSHGIWTCSMRRGSRRTSPAKAARTLYAEPAVRFCGVRSEGFRALAVALQHGFPFAPSGVSGPSRDGHPHGPDWELAFRRGAGARRRIVTAVTAPTPVGAWNVVSVALDLFAVAALGLVVIDQLVLRPILVRVGVERGHLLTVWLLSVAVVQAFCGHRTTKPRVGTVSARASDVSASAATIRSRLPACS